MSESSPTFWPTGPNNREETGPIGDGTPHARMHWFWERMRKYERLVGELTDWSPGSSKYRFEAAIVDAFDKLADREARCRELEEALEDFAAEVSAPTGRLRLEGHAEGAVLYVVLEAARSALARYRSAAEPQKEEGDVSR